MKPYTNHEGSLGKGVEIKERIREEKFVYVDVDDGGNEGVYVDI